MSNNMGGGSGGGGLSKSMKDAIARAEKYAEEARKTKPSLEERRFDIENGGIYDAVLATKSKRANYIKVGDTISTRPGITNDKQLKGWTLVDSNMGKIDLLGQNVKITGIESTNKTVTIIGEIKIAGRRATTTRKVKKRFNKNDSITLERR